MEKQLKQLAKALDGEVHYGPLMRRLYATDASVYRQLPLAVVLPRHAQDIQQSIRFAHQNGLSIIPRAAGTSLAGQCVGEGIVVDVSKYLNRILEIQAEENWVRLEPGVIRDELNMHLKKYGLWFGPNTSTANRCMIGGMLGNNSCGSTSIVYGSTRDHVLEIKGFLSDGSPVHFKALQEGELAQKLAGQNLESRIYQQLHQRLSDPAVKQEIKAQFPKSSIHRRNTGYAIDLLLQNQPFDPKGDPMNLCQLIAGSEGTLAFITEIKLHVDPLPPVAEVLLCAHFHSIETALKAVLIAMRHRPYACELMDKIILDCTKDSLAYQKNRFFLEGDPEAILIVEFRADDQDQATQLAEALKTALEIAGLGYAFPQLQFPQSQMVWELRKAGLGLLANLPGDRKAVACIEDTAVALEDLPAYITEFSQLMSSFQQEAVYYAHAGAGELHLRPILDLKNSEDRRLFREISLATAKLVKKYQGSLSGEHGDGRVRAEFIPLMIGEKNYALLREIKQTWDPKNIFNPGKIVDAPVMNESLRYEAEQETLVPNTVFDYTEVGGILRAAEKCNGSGDCRKLALSGGTMCPSYQATRDEKDTTRGRANALREFLSQNSSAQNPFDEQSLYEVMDLCISCKGCTSECPSSVDMASMKAEFLHQYYKSNGIPLRAKIFANNAQMNEWAMLWPSLSNFALSNPLSGTLMKKLLGIAPARSFPRLHAFSLRKWYKKHWPSLRPTSPSKGTLVLFCDEYTNVYDVEIGIKAIQLLARLGYEVKMPAHSESGRAHMSKGLLEEARVLAQQNVEQFSPIIHESQPLVGIEPSALLSFRDEYPRLLRGEWQQKAKALKEHCLLIDEFISREIQAGRIDKKAFTEQTRNILLHGHCHQKALADLADTVWMLNLPTNYSVEVIPSGCCGMAGSFGYEKEHYEVSMAIGELVLFPAVRKAEEEVLIAAPGTSCRHQIQDGTARKALHPIEILFEALA
ncbi:MAG: FAD-linked oxidase C-terminal domain-containing protein [Bacteroidota bacterium]